MKNLKFKIRRLTSSKLALLWIWSFAFWIFFAGCTVGPNYEKPKISIEKNFAEAGKLETTNSPSADWWKTFNDPELEKLIGEAARENYNLRIATARVREARFRRNIAAADLFPNVDADAGYAHSRGSKNVNLPLGGGGGSSGGSSGSSSGSSSSHVKPQAQSQSVNSGSANDSAFDNQLNPFGKGGLPGAETDLYQAGFDATWEIDVFGATRRRVEFATDQIQAGIEARRNTMITLFAEVARNYLELRGAQLRMEIAKKNLVAQKEILELTRSRAAAGLTSQADVVRATAEVSTTASAIPPLEASVRQMIHVLSILIAREPNALSVELESSKPLPPAPPEIPIGLPSQLLERRPDIRRAERQIAAATANIGGAEADLFPKFALVSSAGLDSSSPENLFDWQSRYFLISPTVTWRIFDAGRIISNIRLQKANQQEAALQFRSAILTALREVEDSLVAYATELTRRNDLSNALRQNELALTLARQRYEHGLASFLEVLDAERNVLSSRDTLAQSDLSANMDLVALYKALGGGWQTENAGTENSNSARR